MAICIPKTKPFKRLLQLKEVISILPAQAATFVDNGRDGRRITLCRVAEKLRICWQADVDHASDRLRFFLLGLRLGGSISLTGSWMKRSVVHCVAVYFAVIEVGMYFFGVGGWYVVCCAPDNGVRGVGFEFSLLGKC